MRNFGCKLVVLVGFSTFGVATEAIGQSPGLLAQAQAPAAESHASWMIKSLGLFGFAALLAGAAIFVGACLVVFLARRPAVIASYLVFLSLPMLLAIIGALKGTIASFAVLAITDVQIKPSELFAGLSEALLLPLSALTVTLPSYLVISIGLFVRTLCSDERPPTHGRTA